MQIKYLASKKQLPGFYIGGTLVENELTLLLVKWITFIQNRLLERMLLSTIMSQILPEFCMK